MNTKTSFLFQFSEYKWAVLLFYLVSLLIMGTSITFSDGASVSGLEVATCFFLLVCGMNFQSTLMFHLQMGSTRRTFFKGWLLSSCAVCLMTAALNLTVLLISQLIGMPIGSPHLCHSYLFGRTAYGGRSALSVCHLLPVYQPRLPAFCPLLPFE